MTLPLLPPAEAERYIADVRARVLDSLDQVRLGSGEPLIADGFVYGMVIQHEHQHDESMLATHQLRRGAPALEESPACSAPASPAVADVGGPREGASLASGLAGVVEAVGSVGGGRLNLLASDGVSLAATVVGDELFVREGAGAVVLASEPFDDDAGWREVADGSLVIADEADVKVVSL